jgi:hypothetical protein
MGTDRLHSHFLSPPPTRSRDVYDGRNQTVLVAARDVSTGRKPASTGDCRDASADRTTGQYWGAARALWWTSWELASVNTIIHGPHCKSPEDKQKACMGRSSETSVLPHYSQPANLLINGSTSLI